MTLEERVLRPVYKEKEHFSLKKFVSRLPLDRIIAVTVVGIFGYSAWSIGLPSEFYRRAQSKAAMESILSDGIVTDHEMKAVKEISAEMDARWSFIYPSLPGLIAQAKTIHQDDQTGRYFLNNFDSLLGQSHFDAEKAEYFMTTYEQKKGIFAKKTYSSELERRAALMKAGIEASRMKETVDKTTSYGRLKEMREETAGLLESIKGQKTAVHSYLEEVVAGFDKKMDRLNQIVRELEVAYHKMRDREMEPSHYSSKVKEILREYPDHPDINLKLTEYTSLMEREKIDRIAKEHINKLKIISFFDAQGYLQEAETIRSKYDEAGFPVWEDLETAIRTVKGIQNDKKAPFMKEYEVIKKQYEAMKGDSSVETREALKKLRGNADSLLQRAPSQMNDDIQTLSKDISSHIEGMEPVLSLRKTYEALETKKEHIVEREPGWGGLLESFLSGVKDVETKSGTQPEEQRILAQVRDLRNEVLASAKPFDWETVKTRISKNQTHGINEDDAHLLSELELGILKENEGTRLDQEKLRAYYQLRNQRRIAFYTPKNDQVFFGPGKFTSPPRKRVRSEPQYSTSRALELEFKKEGAFDRTWNPRGNITNLYQVNEDMVYDHQTGLMWTNISEGANMPYDRALSFVEELNKQRYKGYSDWRLPTAIELGTVYESVAKCGDEPVYYSYSMGKVTYYQWGGDESQCRQHNPVFDTRLTSEYWTSDKHAISQGESIFDYEKAWVIDFKEGSIVPKERKGYNGGVKVVRSHTQPAQ